MSIFSQSCFGKLVIETALCDQLVVSARFHYALVTDAKDPVGISDRLKSVGDNEGRLVLCELVQGFLYDHLGFGVNGAGSFVHDDDRRIL